MVNTMPYDYRWPRFEDLELVRIGDWFVDACGDERRVAFIEFHKRYLFIHTVGEAVCCYNYGERVKRPPVLAADGEPLEDGQTVWHTKTGAEYRVLSLPDGEKGAWLGNSYGKYFLDYAVLTHQRPVLDADGVPIKEDDMVYSKETGGRFEVTGFTNDGFVICWDMDKCESDIEILPSDLTHTKPESPDSWERIEDDAGCTVSKYNELRGTIFTTKQQVARDLVRRCKEVARKENNNE